MQIMPPIVAWNYADAEQHFCAEAMLVLCIDGDRDRHQWCVTAAEAKLFFASEAAGKISEEMQ